SMSRCASASTCPPASRRSSTATGSLAKACSTMAGAKVAKSFGDAPVIQCTIACGSDRNFAKSERSSADHGMRPSWAHSVRRNAPRADQGAVSFIQNRPPPAADLILPPIQLPPANAASADHDDAAVPPAVGADACRLGIGDENRHAIGMLVPSRSLELAGLA